MNPARLATGLAAGLTLLALAAPGCGDKVETRRAVEPEIFEWPAEAPVHARIHVLDRGTIELALYPEVAPATVENFAKLAREGFYDGTTFHRVIPGFMIQGGDPNTRDDDPKDDGDGGPGYTIEDEFNFAPHARGVVSMANMGRPNTAGSQFFIVHADARHLDGKHAAFGRVVSGLDVLDQIASVETDEHGRWGPKNRPIESVVIERIEIREATATRTGPVAGRPASG